MRKNITNMSDDIVIEKDITIIYTRPFAIRREELDLFAIICNIFHEWNNTITIFEYPPTMIKPD